MIVLQIAIFFVICFAVYGSIATRKIGRFDANKVQSFSFCVLCLALITNGALVLASM